tara:strand:- start:494 stop:1519 length:1026 start_codon:yes stop_codon:yes gene_type:complete
MKIFIIILFLILFNKHAYSNNLFETIFYDIEFTSENIEGDKILSVNKIKNKSILSILKKTLTENDYLKINSQLTDDLINTFIKNIVINDEKIINNKYISKIRVNFDKKKIIDFFRLNKIPYVEYHPTNFLLIIYEINELNNNLFTKNNNHYKFYNENKKNNNLFKIPNLDINDRFILKEEDIIKRDLNKINKFSDKYNSIENIIIIAKNDKDKITYDLIMNSNGNILEKKLILNKNEMDLFYNKLENETINLWKQLNKIQNENLNILNCEIIYFNIFELKEIRNNLSNVSTINNLNIKKLSYKSINYEIYYYGNFEILFKIFELNKLKITHNENRCTIRLI